MRVVLLPSRPHEQYQCQLPQEDLNPGSLGYKGYREKRAAIRPSFDFAVDPHCCMRTARYEVDGQKLCAQHAGLKALEFLAK